jgi:hypothetical protein
MNKELRRPDGAYEPCRRRHTPDGSGRVLLSCPPVPFSPCTRATLPDIGCRTQQLTGNRLIPKRAWSMVHGETTKTSGHEVKTTWHWECRTGQRARGQARVDIAASLDPSNAVRLIYPVGRGPNNLSFKIQSPLVLSIKSVGNRLLHIQPSR